MLHKTIEKQELNVQVRSGSAYSCTPRRQINVHVGIISEEERAQHPDLNGIGAFGSRVGYPWVRSLPYEDNDLNGEHASSQLKHDPMIPSCLPMAESGKYSPLSVFLVQEDLSGIVEPI